MKTLAALAALLALALTVAACGETVIDSAKTEDAIESNLEKSAGLTVSSVDCPSDVEVEKGATFECAVAVAGGGEQTATLKILNDDADVSLVDLTAPEGGGKSGGAETDGGGE